MGQELNKVELCHFLKVSMNLRDITMFTVNIYIHIVFLSSVLLFLSL